MIPTLNFRNNDIDGLLPKDKKVHGSRWASQLPTLQPINEMQSLQNVHEVYHLYQHNCTLEVLQILSTGIHN